MKALKGERMRFPVISDFADNALKEINDGYAWRFLHSLHLHRRPRRAERLPPPAAATSSTRSSRRKIRC